MPQAAECRTYGCVKMPQLIVGALFQSACPRGRPTDGRGLIPMRWPSVGPPSGGASLRFSSVTGDFAADAASAPAIVCRPPDFMLAGGCARRTRKPRLGAAESSRWWSCVSSETTGVDEKKMRAPTRNAEGRQMTEAQSRAAAFCRPAIRRGSDMFFSGYRRLRC